MSRSAILEGIKINKPAEISLPDLSLFQHNISEEELIQDFIKISTGNMSTVVNIMDSEVPLKTFLEEFTTKNYPGNKAIYNTFDLQEKIEDTDFTKVPVNLFIAEAELGVAENGCLWLDEKILKQRISTFACQHTLLVIDHKNIVPTMHQAYSKLKINSTGYGVFIAGPSKTADIEQSLVIGAQGAVSNTIILI